MVARYWFERLPPPGRGRYRLRVPLPRRTARPARTCPRRACDEKRLSRAQLIGVPRLLTEAPGARARIFEQLARALAKFRDVLYLGRGTSFPIALEGARKLKEISYIHAEGRVSSSTA